MTTVFHWNGRLYADSRATQGHQVADNTIKLMGDIQTLTGAAGTIAGMHSFLNMFYETLQQSHVDQVTDAIQELTRIKYKTRSCSESSIILLYKDHVFKFSQEVSISLFGRNRARWMLVQSGQSHDRSEVIAIGSGKSYIQEYFAHVGQDYFDPFEAMTYASYRDKYTGGYMVSKSLGSNWVERKKLINPHTVWIDMVANRLVESQFFVPREEFLWTYDSSTS